MRRDLIAAVGDRARYHERQQRLESVNAWKRCRWSEQTIEGPSLLMSCSGAAPSSAVEAGCEVLGKVASPRCW